MLIWGKREAVYFYAGDWKDSITLERAEEIRFFAHRRIAGKGASSRRCTSGNAKAG